MARYIIVGGVAGGASTAARLRRLNEHAEIVLFERGPYISYANCGLPYYAGETIKERERLFVMTPEKFNAWLNVDVRIRTEVISIDREAKKIRARELDSGREYSLEYNALVLSPGAEPIKPPIPGIEDPRIFTLRSVSDIDHIKEYLDTKRPDRIIVVGGGFIGLEMAENLHARGSFVTIVEALDQVMNPIDFEMAALVHQHLKQKNVELYLSSAVLKFEEAGSRIVAVLADGTRLDADMIVLSIGVRPETAIAKAAGLETTPNGAILVNENLQTSDPAIYALGDAIAFPHPVLDMAMPVPLAGPANKQARVVADNIAKGPGTRKWHGAIGTSIAKVFDITVAAAGVAEKLLRRNNIPCISIITHGSSHASYYPGAQPLTIKTIFTPDGTLLGAQVVGYDGVDKRIDLIADYIRRKAKVTELGEIEHAYAPPFSSAKDPVNIAGMVAENVLAGLSRHLQWHEVKAFQEKGGFVLDVRTPEEFSIGAIPGAKNIPLDSLRQNLGEIPQNREVLIYCGVGLRGYLAERILRQNGWTSIANLSGGYKTWEIATEPQSNKGIYKPGFVGFQSGLGKGSQELLHTTFAEGSGMPESFAAKSQTIVQVDACGLQCPGPIMRLKTEIDKLPEGGRVVIRSTDPGFVRDAGAWCKVTGNLLISMEESNGTYTAMIEKTAKQSAMAVAQETEGIRGEPFVQMTAKGATIIVFSNDFDRALASFVLANGAAAAGKDVTMFFTFWGLSVIRKPNAPRVAKDFMGRMFGMMLPKHAGGLSLSHMNFGGIGPKLMKSRMKSKNIDMLETMMSQARQAGVHFIACQMSMDIMGVKHEELLDGVEVGGVATYMEAATEGNVNLFI
ncbi:MAG TPA: FAD-dependent oxidoreductase [Rectinema sp.]|jgi:NADPH-dependent 2,4-dienoyl-CoA reductase/sulfur reductase-like enzyme/peroxiredoxin family protein/rhodanese-related sulfurtransferase/TusA-related sulfurtransferase|nr:FAD-dependent oxidoreductase [Rectinema sp.]